MVGTDPDRSGGRTDIYELFCHYNALYFHDSLGACAVSWTEDPLPDRDLSNCDYYPGGGGCIIHLSKSLYDCHTESDLKNVLLHEMIHAYICIRDNKNNHSDHGTKFQAQMNTINMNAVADPHRPIGGYRITTLHEIRKKHYEYKCESCGDLVKSIKIRGPSHDDCIERMGANDMCQNVMCHWHRHKKRCSGSYHRVQESSPGCVQLKDSKALAEEALDEGKAKEACESWRTTHKSNKCVTNNKHEMESSSELLNPSDAIGRSGVDSSSRDRSSKKIKLSKDIGFDLTSTTGHEAPKRQRTASLKKNQECTRQKRRKLNKWNGSYSVISEWLNFYCVDESDEDEVPLINKRTERRKRQKLLKISQATGSSNGVEDDGSASRTVNGKNCVGSGDQAGNKITPPSLNSPITDEIVDISDG